MPSIRIGFGSDFSLKNNLVGIGTTTANRKLEVAGTLKGDLSITGVSTLAVYGGFAAQKQNVTKDSSIGFSTTGVGTFIQVDESETGFLSLVGEYNTVSEDIIVDDGKIFEISTTNITGITTLGTQEVYAPDDSVVSVGTLESVSIQSHFSFPDGGINDRPDQPVEGMVRFNDDLNTLEFYNGIEWRQFTVSGASGRGVFGGGQDPSARGTIDYINISTLGNAINFGTLTRNARWLGACSSSTRGLFGGGDGSSPTTDDSIIDYVTLASAGNAISFGSLVVGKGNGTTALSSSTRGIWGGGYDRGPNVTTNTIDYVTIATIGNALDFGDLVGLASANKHGSCSSPTRGLFGGGTPYTSTLIEYITISSLGNSIRFGDLTYPRGNVHACSNSVRGLFFKGYNSNSNGIDYVTIATTGNAINFGDAGGFEYQAAGATASQTRGIIAGGFNTPTNVNTIQYVTIASTGNAQDFGDLTSQRRQGSACSDSHGGLGGF